MTIDAFMSAFTFESFKCEVSFNGIVDPYTGDKTKELVLRNNNEKFRAAYLYGEGLKEISREKSRSEERRVGKERRNRRRRRTEKKEGEGNEGELPQWQEKDA